MRETLCWAIMWCRGQKEKRRRRNFRQWQKPKCTL